jgi:hypothetical protein
MPGAQSAPPRADDSRRGQNAPSARTGISRGYTPPRAAKPAGRLASNPDALVALADRLWRAIERVTGRPPAYMGPLRLASYCPACLDGTVSIRLLRHPAPSAAFACSRGCAEPAIAAALRSAAAR